MKLKEILKMLSILIMYILVFGLTYLTYIVVSLSDSRIFTETFKISLIYNLLNVYYNLLKGCVYMDEKLNQKNDYFNDSSDIEKRIQSFFLNGGHYDESEIDFGCAVGREIN